MRTLRGIQPQLRLTRARIGPVARKTAVRQDRPDVAIVAGRSSIIGRSNLHASRHKITETNGPSASNRNRIREAAFVSCDIIRYP